MRVLCARLLLRAWVNNTAAVPCWHLRPLEWFACQCRLHGRPSRLLCPGRKHRAHELPIMGLLPWTPGGLRQ